MYQENMIKCFYELFNYVFIENKQKIPIKHKNASLKPKPGPD